MSDESTRILSVVVETKDLAALVVRFRIGQLDDKGRRITVSRILRRLILQAIREP